MKRTSICAVLLAFALFPWAVPAQTVLGMLEGRVTDASGKPVPGAAITVTHDETGQKREAVSDANGGFRSVQLPPGPCRLEVEKTAFGSYAQNLDVLTDQKVRLEDRKSVV